MIVLDASVLIAHLSTADAHHIDARDLLDAAAQAADDLAASSLTLAEVLVGPAHTGILAKAEAALRRLGVAEVPLPAGSPGRLAMMRAETGLKLPDCCVILAAEAAGASVATFDHRLHRVAEDRGLASGPLG